MQPDRGTAMGSLTLLALALSAMLATARPALTSASASASVPAAAAASAAEPANLPGCGPAPSWIVAGPLVQEAGGPLGSCLQSSSNQAEVVLRIADDRPYAQLITVRGAQLDLQESSFGSTLEGTLAGLLASASAGEGPTAFLLGPGQEASLVIDRPPPGVAREVHIDPAPDNGFAVAALAWRLLSAAATRLTLPSATLACVADAIYGSLWGPPHPHLALQLVHSCVDAAGLPAPSEQRLQRLASELLRDRFFKEVIHREGTEAHPARIAFTFAASNPELIDPEIRLDAPNLGTVPGGRRTVEHLSASGGTPPYRFYIVPESGGEGVPSWLQLAADGTLTLEPPAGTSVDLPVEVVDAHGEHSLISS
jgi:hypothetical protein